MFPSVRLEAPDRSAPVGSEADRHSGESRGQVERESDDCGNRSRARGPVRQAYTEVVLVAQQVGLLHTARDANLRLPSAGLFAVTHLRPKLTGADLIEVVEQDSAAVGTPETGAES